MKATEPQTFDGEKIPVVKNDELDNVSNLTNPQISHKEMVEQKYREENRTNAAEQNHDEEKKEDEKVGAKEQNLKTIMLGSRKAATKLAKAEGSGQLKLFLENLTRSSVWRGPQLTSSANFRTFFA